MLLVSPCDMIEVKLDQSFKRIEHFTSLTGGRDLAMVFLLSPPAATSFVSAKDLASGTTDEAGKADAVQAYCKLQAEMVNHAEIPYIPILPLCQIDGLSQLLHKHIANVDRSIPKRKPSASSLDILQLCTANPPMSQQTMYILSDLFPTLSDLATVCLSSTSAPNSSSPSVRAAGMISKANGTGLVTSTQSSDVDTSSKLKQLRALVGEQQFQDIVDFWMEEWTVD